MKEQDGGFLITIFKNQVQDEPLIKVGLNERQLKAVAYVKEHGFINNAQFQKINSIGKTMATEELQQLVNKAILIQAGSKGRGSKYMMALIAGNWPRINHSIAVLPASSKVFVILTVGI
jgi:ATP-dependent DNA helicase RecG